MQIEMISTGEEVLSGQIVDTNAAWLGNILADAGLELARRTTVGDRLDDLVELFVERSHKADIILVNGGLGPTADDLSAEAMAKAMGVALEENTWWRERMTAWFASRARPMAQTNLKQCLLPLGAEAIDNPVGTACGFVVKFNRASLFFTPGVPHEFKRMVKEQFLPFVEQRSEPGQMRVAKWLTLGYGESRLAQTLESLSWPQGISLGYRSSMPYIEVKLIGRDVADQAFDQAAQQLKNTLGSALVASEQTSLAGEVHRLLNGSGKRLAVAESLTGGALASSLVAFPGSSSYLVQGQVTYCNEAKQQLLAVPADTIEQFGVVSVQTAMAMAEGARDTMDSDLAMATTGVAGPDGGSEALPVGSVAIAVASRERVVAQLVLLPGRSRNGVRDLTVAIALDMLRREVLGQEAVADYGFIERREQASLCYS